MINIPKEQDKFGLAEFLNGYLKNRQDAVSFLFAYRDYCHHIDDIIDVSDRRNDPNFILGGFNMALDILSSSFYQANISRLYSVVKTIQNEYAVSVKWENETDSWKKNISDVIRNCANLMVVTVVDIVVTQETGNPQLGFEAGLEISWRAKAQSYSDHHTTEGVPV